MGCSSGCCLLISSQAISSHYQDLAFKGAARNVRYGQLADSFSEIYAVKNIFSATHEPTTAFKPRQEIFITY